MGFHAFFIRTDRCVMKQDIHPEYHDDAVITCACGAKYETGSTTKNIEIEICAACHPYYTGKQKYVDTTGRVERFKQLAERSKEKQVSTNARTKAEKNAARRAKQAEAKAKA